jgi:hypothetical protein
MCYLALKQTLLFGSVSQEHLEAGKIFVRVVFEEFREIHVVERVENANEHSHGSEEYLKSGRVGSLSLYLLASELRQSENQNVRTTWKTDNMGAAKIARMVCNCKSITSELT